MDQSLDDRIAANRGGRGRRGGGRGDGAPRGRGRGVKRDYPADALDDGGAPEPMIKVARRIFVNNLPFDLEWQDLKDHFSTVGKVVFADILRNGGKSKGCGIVEFSTPTEAAEAINTMHNTLLKDRQIFIREDREDKDLLESNGGRPPAPGRGSDPKRGRTGDRGQQARSSGPARTTEGGSIEVGRRVYVNNLSYSTTWQALKDHFKTAGNVVHAQVLEREDHSSKGCGIVEFSTPEEALRSISLLSNTTLGDRVIAVREDREDKAVSRVAGPSHRPGRGTAGTAGSAQGQLPSGLQILVQGLPYSAQWQELKDLAGQNAVHAEIATDQNGRSKGFGTVKFSSKEEANAAVAALNGKMYKERTLGVKIDKFA